MVAHLSAPARLSVATERKRRIEDVVAVDPDGTGAQLRRDGVGLADVPSPYGCREAVNGVIGTGNKFFEFAKGDSHDYRAEDFLLNDFHVRPRVH